MAWILLAAVLIFAILVALMRRGTIYVMHPMGFVGSTSKRRPIRHVSMEQFQVTIEHLIQGTTFDFLWISYKNDEYSGVCLQTEADYVEMSVDFRIRTERDDMASFRAMMDSLGYQTVDESTGNPGLESECRMLEYHVPRDPDKVRAAALLALTHLQGEAADGIYLKASNMAIFRERRRGIRYASNQDPLSGILD